MAATAVYRCMNHVFSVAADRPEDLAVLQRALAPFSASPRDTPSTGYQLRTDVDGRHWLYVDGRQARVSEDPAEPLDLLFWYVGEGVVRDEQQHLILHAGAVVSADGRALLLPGPSGCGKSTTTLGLVGAGLGYLSDEFAVLDPASGRVAGFPRPLVLKTGSRALMPELDQLALNVPTDHLDTVHVPVERLGGAPYPGTAEPGWVVFPTYADGASSELTPLSPGMTCIELMRSTFRLQEDPRRALDVLGAVARKAQGYRLRVGDLDEAVELLVGLTTPPDSHTED